MKLRNELPNGVHQVLLNDLFELPGFEQCVTAYEDLGRQYIETGFEKGAYLALGDRKIIALACVHDGQCVGFGGLIPNTDRHYGKLMLVDSIFVKSAYRKMGYGEKLLEKIKQVSRENGCKALLFSAMSGTALEKVFSRRYKKFCTMFYEGI